MSAITERRIKEVVSMKRKKGRVEHQSYLVEGIRLVESALISGTPIVEIFATPDVIGDERLAKAMAKAGKSAVEVSNKIMAKMSDTSTPSGVLAVASVPNPTHACISCLSKVLVLDGVQDPGNVGALIRSAAWFGVEAVVAGPGTADYFAPKTVRASMGGMWDLILEQVDFLPGFIATNIRAGVDVQFADMTGLPVTKWSPAAHSMLVIGSEAHGVSEEVRSACAGSITIPGKDKARAVESLNAAVAGSILMSHWQ